MKDVRKEIDRLAQDAEDLDTSFIEDVELSSDEAAKAASFAGQSTDQTAVDEAIKAIDARTAFLQGKGKAGDTGLSWGKKGVGHQQAGRFEAYRLPIPGRPWALRVDGKELPIRFANFVQAKSHAASEYSDAPRFEASVASARALATRVGDTDSAGRYGGWQHHRDETGRKVAGYMVKGDLAAVRQGKSPLWAIFDGQEQLADGKLFRTFEDCREFLDSRD